jgi:HEAT repeat protein
MLGKKFWWATAVVGLALFPSVFVVHRALADEEEEGDDADAETTPLEELSKKKKVVLAAIPTNESILINVTQREMPASPDLLNLGKRATKALARCVADNVDDAVRIKCAMVLGRIGDRSALPALQGALEAWNPSVRGVAIHALRSMPDVTSVDPLIRIVQREDEDIGNRCAALEALGSMSDQKAVKALRFYLHDEKSGAAMNVSAFSGLWRTRALMARTTMIQDVAFALKSEDSALIVPATFAASELRAPELVDALVPLMKNVDAHVRNRAVYALGKIGDKQATKALLEQVPAVREARMLNNIAFALERLDPKAFYATIPSLVTHKQATIRMNATFVLGDVRRPEGLPLLEKALGDPNDYVRVSAVAAIGKLDAPEAAPVLEPLVNDKNPSLRITAITSIFALTNGKRSDLVYDKLFAPADAKPGTKLMAALMLSAVDDPRVVDTIVSCTELGTCSGTDDYLLAMAPKEPTIPARMLLQWAKGRHDVTTLVADLKPPGAGALAIGQVKAALGARDLYGAAYAIDLAGALGEPSAAAVLPALLQHETARVRVHAAVALVREDGASAADAATQLWKDFDTMPVDRLPALARLMGKISEPKARARLDAELKRRETSTEAPIALAAAAVRLSWDPDAAFFRFLDAIGTGKTLDRELAQAYLSHDRRAVITYVMRRALAREERPAVRDLLRKMLDARAGHDDA